MNEGPYRDSSVVQETRLKIERDRYKKLYVDLQEEMWEYKQRRWLWFQTSTALLIILLPMYWALLLDMEQWTVTMEPKHVCDPAPACELRLQIPLDSSRSSH